MDGRIAVWVATHRIGALNDVFVGLGTVEKLGLVWVVAAIAIALGRRCGRGATALLAVTVFIAALGADAASFGLKDLVHRTRPSVAHPQIHPLYAVHSSSFPAGHAATAFAGATVLAFAVPRAAPLLYAVAAVIGVSRVYVGVHYPTDVIGGAVLGTAVGLLAVVVVRIVRRRRAESSGWAPNLSS